MNMIKNVDFWVTFNGNVCDVSKMISKKPKLNSKLLFASGQDLDSLYNLFKQYYIKKEIPFITNYETGHLSKNDENIQVKQIKEVGSLLKKKH